MSVLLYICMLLAFEDPVRSVCVSGVEEQRNWDCRDKSPPSYESAASTKGNNN